MLSKHYYSYLMRIWQTENPFHKGWFASLEDPSTKETMYFNSMEALFAFIQERSNNEENKVADQNKA